MIYTNKPTYNITNRLILFQEGYYTADGDFEIPLEDTLKDAYRNIPSDCIGECLQCQRESSGEEEFMYIAGDLHIGGNNIIAFHNALCVVIDNLYIFYCHINSFYNYKQ